jgi:molybdenum cofactor cytidylyltransferase
VIVALIPAAGRSTRMGRPKLILSVDGVPLIARVVAALRDGGAGRVVVVAPPITEPGSLLLIEAAEGQGAEMVIARSPTADMRASVELGLEDLARGTEPSALLLTPGDLPGLDPGLVAGVIDASDRAPGRIIVPWHEGRRGHPVLIPWSLAKQIPRLPPGVGVNALLADHPDKIVVYETEDRAILDDLDTPDDLQRWARP